ncbi:MAG TPA: SDR family oxidoreductase [Phycisphaerales bacterium]|nr:SDR family oxidoreductase [Phycisphaerales bacterium]HMP37999.1 SDR family oxidoreductase [Phycisphaerales bacterium]
MPVAIVTGAGSGIGRAIAQRLGRAGWNLALVGRSEERLRETEALLGAAASLPAGLELIAADLSDPASVRAAIETTGGVFSRIDVLVNNAGFARGVPIEATEIGFLEELFAVNTFAPALAVAAAWPIFRAQRSGRVVNISSMSAFDPFPGFLVYAGTKAALDGITRAIAVEGAALGIKAFSVNPGAVETPLLRSLFSTQAVPPSSALDPRGVAELVWECAAGLRDFDNGRAIPIVAR